MYYISYGCSFIKGSKSYNWKAAAWRVPGGLQMVPAVLLFFATFMPESPRWLAQMDHWRRHTMLIGAIFMCAFMFANLGIQGSNVRIIPMDQRTTAEESMSVTGSAAKGLIECTYLFVASYAPTWGRLVSSPPGPLPTHVFCTFIHVFFMFPEPTGTTLKEMEAMFEDPDGLKLFGTPAWKTRVQTMQTVAMEHDDIETAKAHAVVSDVRAKSEEKTTFAHE
ncbi:Hexose transporter [Penicillium atrosanguineum]|uniref:Hexose transporter n=1 Tax=Penicillium atrosanguineum TaxID=1132637 RepID=A0A9W9Q0Q7_9EURO|nr:Hexose transporter [Penicillium atrosanguineum]